jgi:hypothetical protein
MHGMRKKPKRGGAAYEVHKEHSREWAARVSVSGREIGELPRPANPKRRKRGETSFRAYCEAYFPEVFYLPWSEDHLKAIATIENAILHGGLFALAMPRGSGKTSLCECAAMWGVSYGRRKFVALIGAEGKQASEMLDSIRSEFENNEVLAADFPEICVPIERLGGIAQRARGQLHNGKRTMIRWEADVVVLPTIEGSAASGAIIKCAGITGRIRGMKHKRPNGKADRPDVAIIDDPQNRESANSLTQIEDRLSIIKADVLRMAGPGKKIAAFAPMTVIARGDLADRLLDREKFPQWQGFKTKAVYSFPNDKKLWAEYAEILQEAVKGGAKDEPFSEKIARSTEFYRAHRKEMDEGAVVGWPERFEPGEISGIQSMMNIKILDPSVFAAEFQNEPLLSDEAARLPTAAQICAKANGYKRGVLPDKAVCVTAFIDVGDNYLAWLVAAWQSNFTGAVIDYGTWPDQGKTFSKGSVKRSLQQAYPGSGVDGAILAGLKDLGERLLARDFIQESGPPLQIGLCLIDTGYEPDPVRAAIRIIGRRATLRGSRGRGITAGKTQFDDYKRDRCREMGLHWWVPKDTPDATIQIDTNFWKSFVHGRLATVQGDPGALTLFGQPQDHGLLAEHILAEYFSLPSTEKGVSVQEWHQYVGKDNEFFDCLVGAAAAAACRGCSLLPAVPRVRTRRHFTASVPARAFDPALG